MSFLAKLSSNRAADQNRLEDFLSEALCELLRLVCADRNNKNHTSRFIRSLLDEPFCEWDAMEVRWQTQFVLPNGPRSVAGRRPDIHGAGIAGQTSFEVIIECKVGAHFTFVGEKDDENGHQIKAYGTWLLDCSRGAIKKLILITEGWRPLPDVGEIQVVSKTWAEMHTCLLHLAKDVDSSLAISYLAFELANLLEELNMTHIKLTLPLVSAFEHYDAAIRACRQLGDKAKRFGNSLQNKVAQAGLFPPAYTWNEMNEPAYYGALFAPGTKRSQKGIKPDDSNLILWCGVLAKHAYVLKPRQVHIPELNAGVAVWIERSNPEALHSVMDILGKLELRGFTVTTHDNDETHVRSAVVRRSFFELLMTDDATHAAEDFFTRAFADLEAIAVSDYIALKRLARH